jgi:hypothetical protein
MSGEEGIAGVLAGVLMAHTDETCHDRNCGSGFGYHDCDSREERRAGCEHLANVVLAWIEEKLASEAVREAVAEELLNVGHQPPSHAEVAFMDVRHAALSALATATAAFRDQP